MKLTAAPALFPVAAVVRFAFVPAANPLKCAVVKLSMLLLQDRLLHMPNPVQSRPCDWICAAVKSVLVLSVNEMRVIGQVMLRSWIIAVVLVVGLSAVVLTIVALVMMRTAVSKFNPLPSILDTHLIVPLLFPSVALLMLVMSSTPL